MVVTMLLLYQLKTVVRSLYVCVGYCRQNNLVRCKQLKALSHCLVFTCQQMDGQCGWHVYSGLLTTSWASHFLLFTGKEWTWLHLEELKFGTINPFCCINIDRTTIHSLHTETLSHFLLFQFMSLCGISFKFTVKTGTIHVADYLSFTDGWLYAQIILFSFIILFNVFLLFFSICNHSWHGRS